MRNRGRRLRLFLILFFALVAGALPAAAQVPSFREVAGHEFGERITMHHQMVRYLERLAEASPRVRLVEQGHSWQGRSLPLAIVTAPENHARLEEIQRTAQRLADPRTVSPAEVSSLVARQPVVVWLGGSIHGFELSGSEGVLKLLEHLTTRDDPATLEVLQSTVVLIDPMLNPDGRDAFAAANHDRTGRHINPSRDDWNNDWTGWEALQFRTGHYFFDTNRDWFAHTQRETQARLPTFRAWRPQVAVDLHEMSPDVEFFFDPPTEPYGPFFPEFAREGFRRFGAAYATAFDEAGFEYMTGERYNYFYPGYTTSYHTYQGAIGMLYEQGSTRGLAITRPDGSVRSLADALEQQYVAAWTALRTSAQQRESLLRDHHAGKRAALEDGRRGVRRYLLSAEGDPARTRELAKLLVRNGIEVGALTQPVRLSGLRDRTGRQAGTQSLPAGSIVVEAAQPLNRLVRVLLEPDAPVPPEFLREARARVERDENPRFYDITAFSLPLLFDVAGYSSTDGRALPVQPFDTARIELPPRAAYAYLIDGRQAAARAALYHLGAAGHRAAVTLRPTRIEGEEVPTGTVVVRVGQNEEAIHEAVREQAQRYGLRVRSVGTGLAAEGLPALGSADVVPARAPRIALLAGDPVQGLSFGWAWYTLDQQYELPVTVIRAASLAGMPLAEYDVLVVPEVSGAALARVLGSEGTERLKRWVNDGGTLVAIGAATDFAREQLELIQLRSWYATDAGRNAQRFDVPGAIFRAVLDPESWLAAGYPDGELPVLVNSGRIYLAPEGAPAARLRVAVRYAAGAPLRLAGHAWQESLERLPGAVFAYEERVGRGRVIAFAEDLNFRGFWRGADRLFLNAVVLGPSAP